MPDPNDVSQMARDLAMSEPLMVLGKLAAEGGQHVQDAYDIIKQHLSDLGSKAEQAVETGATAVTNAAKSAGSAVSSAAGKVADAIVPKLKAEEQTPADQYIKLPDGSYAKFPASMSDDDIKGALQKNGYGAPSSPPFNAPRFVDQPQPVLGGASLGQAAEVGKGVIKGGLHTAIGAGELVAPALRQVPGVKNFVASPEQFDQARNATAYSNNLQRAGGVLETVGEMAVPVGRAVDALPSTARAGAKFQDIMGAAKGLPVSIAEPGAVAMRIKELAEHGGVMPRPVSKFINYVSDPERGPIFSYEVARDFASNFSRMSSAEYQRLPPPLRAQVAELAATLNKSIGQTAATVGKGKDYAEAMTEYAKARRLQDFFSAVGKSAVKNAPYATATAIGVGAERWIEGKIKELLGEKP